MVASARRRCRVLWLVKGLGPGGAEHLLVAAASHHDRSRFDLEAAYLVPWKDQLAPALEAHDVPTTCLDVRNERAIGWARRLRDLLLTGSFDIVHAHSPYPAAVLRLVARTLPRARRPRLMYTLHNTWPSFTRPTRMIAGITMRADDIDLAVSEVARATLPSPLRARTEVLIHGIDLDAARTQRDRDAVRAELGIPDDVVLVGTVANLRKQKDYPNLFAAARRLVDRGVPVRFLTVGQGPLEAELRAERDALGLGGVIEMLGWRTDAVRLMSGCDLYALASVTEGLPVAVMEAQALGLPVVATDVGGMREAVDVTNGVLVPPRDPAALADAIRTLCDDPTRRRSLAAGAAASARRFDIRRTVERLEVLYASLCPPATDLSS